MGGGISEMIGETTGEMIDEVRGWMIGEMTEEKEEMKGREEKEEDPSGLMLTSKTKLKMVQFS